jgi:hypothetical protein
MGLSPHAIPTRFRQPSATLTTMGGLPSRVKSGALRKCVQGRRSVATICSTNAGDTEATPRTTRVLATGNSELSVVSAQGTTGTDWRGSSLLPAGACESSPPKQPDIANATASKEAAEAAGLASTPDDAGDGPIMMWLTT